jgi:hypothetical protein
MNGDAKFVVYSAIDIPAEHTGQVLWRVNPLVPGGREPYVPTIGENKEICQLSIEFPVKPVSEKKFRQAMEQMTNGLIKKATAAGLVFSD